jgi:hypothetical protein
MFHMVNNGHGLKGYGLLDLLKLIAFFQRMWIRIGWFEADLVFRIGSINSITKLPQPSTETKSSFDQFFKYKPYGKQ